ncbi:ATP-binding protein [Sphingopyxis sp. BSN-002]|uniref:ATP-binding protein n=1 Tax=Sphingopyxis sp. BSN-002 TaxID=2911495 RepID=UPI001EDA7B23|nr:ATP-binding protein [Sphingopyxis sp. BSN-002]UKK83809.1 ATP-binding protein [Sphingopyxis sp. BSN-002]
MEAAVMAEGGATKFELKFSHHVIEHLGLKLYQNKPTNVIAELVSNSWDAGAKVVNIDMSVSDDRDSRFVAVSDNGSGMTATELAENYLVIGKPKRRVRGERYAMGRKGIGKLAPFGIANTIDVVTVSGGQATWIKLPLPALLQEGDATAPTEIATYEPRVVLQNSPLADAPFSEDKTGQIEKFSTFIGSGSGTLILLTNLSLIRPISKENIIEGMGRRFTVTLNREDFSVFVNGDKIEDDTSLPKFEFRIPKTGFSVENIGGNQVRYWVGFVKVASWPSDEAGVGVYAHGKIAQDRPFTFGVKGREIFTRYMYAVVEADFLDEQNEDVISTDRSSIDWDNPIALQLYEWGAKNLRLWIEEYRVFRSGDEERRIQELVESKISQGELPKIRDDEKAILSKLLAEVTPSLPKHDGSDEKVTAAVMKAYLHVPTRTLLKRLWSSYSKDGSAEAGEFLGVVEKIADAAIPEALSIAVTFAERAYAISCLSDYQHSRGEPEMQKLLERFPWIIQPGYEKLTANQQLKTLVMEAAKRGLSPSRVDLSNPVDEETKPDFVFYSDLEKAQIVVVELKTPRDDLTLSNREQLASYLTYLEQQYPSSKIEGILVGSNGKGLEPKRDDLRIMSWADVLNESRRGHVDMLAAMLKTADPDPDDARIQQIIEFGGPDVWRALERVATNDEHLSNLLKERG